MTQDLGYDKNVKLYLFFQKLMILRMGFCMYSMYHQLATVVFWFLYYLLGRSSTWQGSQRFRHRRLYPLLLSFWLRLCDGHLEAIEMVQIPFVWLALGDDNTTYVGLAASCSIVQYWPRPTQQWWMGITTVVPKDRPGALIFMDHINGLTHRSNGILFKKPRPQLPLSIQHDLMILTIQFK